MIAKIPHNHLFNSFILFISLIFIASISSVNLGTGTAYSQSNSTLEVEDNVGASVKNYSSYIDSSNDIVIVGAVFKQANQQLPQNVIVGIDVYNKLTGQLETLTEKPYNPILYRDNEPFPFKFIVDSTTYDLKEEKGENKSAPYIYKSENVTSPYNKINTFELKYPVIPTESDKELKGNITNTSPLQIDNLTLFAIVNDKKGVQIDSVKTFIPVLKPHQTIDFTFTPDPTIKDRVYVYSCVGGDAENMRIDKYKLFTISNYKVLGYKYSDMMVLDELNYNQTNNQLEIKLNNIYPIPGALSLQLMPYQLNPLSVSLDGAIHDSAKIEYADDMVKIDLAIPQGPHEITLSGIEEY